MLRDRPKAVRERFRAAISAGEQVGLSSIVVYELWHGATRSARRVENIERVRGVLSGDIDVIPFDDEDAVRAGELRAALEALGTPIGPYDVLIAAQALRLDATLITANTGEFARVEGLRLEDWSA